jgi:GNAT superfamily N-acetyltransferase
MVPVGKPCRVCASAGTRRRRQAIDTDWYVKEVMAKQYWHGMAYAKVMKKFMQRVLGQRWYHRVSSTLFSIYRPFLIFSFSDFQHTLLVNDRKYEILKIKKKDLPLLKRFISAELTESELCNIPSLTRIEKDFTARVYWGVFTGDRLIGVLWINLFGTKDLEYGCAFAESFRRKGIGTAALHSVERYFLKKGITLFVRVRDGNDASRAFFMRNDFERYDKKGEWSFLRKSQ